MFNVNYFYNNISAPKLLRAGRKEVTMNESNDNKIQKLITKGISILSDMIERYVPENNKFKKIFAAFDIPGTRNEALLSVSHDEIQPKDIRRFGVEVHHLNSDKFYSQYLYKGTKKEVLDFIQNSKNKEIIADSIEKLSNKVNEDYK